MSDKSKAERAEHAARGNGPAAEGNVDQIRDILFGGQMRDYERRFNELEERIRREAEKLRSDLLKRMDGLEELVRENHERFVGQLQRVDKDWREAGDGAAQLAQTQHRAVKNELAALEQKQSAEQQLLRERLHKLGNETTEALRQRADELLGQLERTAADLRDDKVARHELAGFFTEMALRLNREFELPQAQAGKAARG